MCEEIKVKRSICFLLFSISLASNAHTIVGNSVEQERIYLVQLVNQLNALLPVITTAEKSQPKNQRVSFHYSAWHDAKGKRHNGLWEDVREIKSGIEEKLNTVTVEPRVVVPIQGDYLEK
jgi:RAQPRD family integrative conjugative element protein